MTAPLAIPAAPLPRAPGFAGAPEPSALLLTEALQALEDHAAAALEPVDVVIHRALGWRVERRVVRASDGRRAWMVKGPLSATWIPLPRPTQILPDAVRLVPWRWCWGAGVRDAHPYAWVASRWPVAEGVSWFEQRGPTPAFALTKAALFAHRSIALRREGHMP